MLRRRLMKRGGIDPVTGRGYVEGYEVVDLGLPSGTLWATCNFGASTEYTDGDYYRWGYLDKATLGTHDEYSYQYYSIPDDDGYTTLYGSADPARSETGGVLLMPHKKYFDELLQYTDHQFMVYYNNDISTLICAEDMTWRDVLKSPYKMLFKFTSKTYPDRYIYFVYSGYVPEYSTRVSSTNGGSLHTGYWSNTYDYEYEYALYLSLGGGITYLLSPKTAGASVQSTEKRNEGFNIKPIVNSRYAQNIK